MKKRKKLPQAIAEAKVVEKSEKHSSMLWPAISICAAWFIFIWPWMQYQYWQSDTYWLIETGRLILKLQALPTHDPFSYMTGNAHWFVYQWLTEVIFALAEKAGGLLGLAVLGNLIFAALFCILMFRRIIRDKVNPVIALTSIWFCAYAFYPAFSSLRPQLISFVLFWLTYGICRDLKSGMSFKKALLATFTIAVVWANCHISFLAGWVVILCHFLGTLHLFFSKSAHRKIALRYAALFFVFYIGIFFTPLGAQLWTFIADVHNYFYTQEVSPLRWDVEKHRLAVAVAGAVSAIYLSIHKKYDVASVLVMLILLSIGANCSRLFTYFCLFIAPTIAIAINEVLTPYLTNKQFQDFCQSIKKFAESPRYIAAMLGVAVATVLGQPVVLQSNVPVQAAKYLAAHPVKGRLFSTAHAGSYLIYSSHGTIPVFMDTRLDLYDPDLCFRFIKALYSAENWQEMFSQNKIAAALIPNDPNIKLKDALDTSPDWQAEYKDEDFTLFVKKTPPG